MSPSLPSLSSTLYVFRFDNITALLIMTLQIKQRLPQYRGEIKDVARAFVGSPHGPAFRFLTPHTLENQNRNRELVVELKSLEHSFIFKVSLKS
jgi:hypothetical protein